METQQEKKTAQRTVLRAPVTKRDGTSSLKRFNAALMNEDMQKYLATMLGSRKEQFVNNLLAVVGNDIKLQGCTPQTLIYAANKATALGLPLDPNLGFAYIIPYNNTKKVREIQDILNPQTGEVEEREVAVELTVKEAQFQIGYKGFIQLAIRTGQFSRLNVTDIRDGEIGKKNLVTGDIAIKEVENREERPVIGYLAFFALNNGFEKMLYMTMDEIKKHATTYSQTYGSNKDWIKKSSRWTTDFDSMARKTVLKLLLNRYAPLSVDIQGVTQMRDAIRCDQAVIDEQGNPDYVDGASFDEQQDPAATAQSIEEQKEQMRTTESTAPKLL